MKNVEVNKKQWASVHLSNGYISVSASSGYRNCACDPEAYHHVMSDNCSDEKLGESLRNALNKSRFLPIDEVREFFNLDNVEHRYSIFVEHLLDKMEGIPRQKAFKTMKLCNIRLEDGKVKISPTKKARGEAWEGTGFTVKNTQVINFTSTDKELGAATREALACCK